MSIRNKVLAAYQKISPATVREAADYTKLDYKQVSGAVTQLAEQGRLERVSRGVYTYVWNKSEKPVSKLEETTVVMDDSKMMLNTETGEITREPSVDESVSDWVQFTNILTDQEFLQFLVDHDIRLDLINELVLLSYYYQRYVVK